MCSHSLTWVLDLSHFRLLTTIQFNLVLFLRNSSIKLQPKTHSIENTFPVQWLMVMIRTETKMPMFRPISSTGLYCFAFDLHIFDSPSMIIIISRYIIVYGDNFCHANQPIDLGSTLSQTCFVCVCVCLCLCAWAFQMQKEFANMSPITFPIWRTCTYCTNWSPDSNINYKCK